MAPSEEQQQHLADKQVSAEFTSYYLQRATQEFAEDLDKVRTADDFKADNALPMLISALQQGTAMFSPEEQRRIVTAEKKSSS
ncbi:ribosome assembly protein 3 [Podospora australis]|uniref:Ribosome assembly protein 3 n=1 Tax=Podospora australis TaxID=1536484 RepID=A0AAN7AIG9_9PEZI|nr:ribosome assembly protein 3 [Podospora australis]